MKALSSFCITLVVISLLAGGSALAETKEEAAPKQVILINPFKVPEGKLQESIVFWEKARDFLKEQPGYISTKLHQSLKADATFELINVAVWQSAGAYQAATQKMRQQLKVEPIPGLMGDPTLYTVIRE